MPEVYDLEFVSSMELDSSRTLSKTKSLVRGSFFSSGFMFSFEKYVLCETIKHPPKCVFS